MTETGEQYRAQICHPRPWSVKVERSSETESGQPEATVVDAEGKQVAPFVKLPLGNWEKSKFWPHSKTLMNYASDLDHVVALVQSFNNI